MKGVLFCSTGQDYIYWRCFSDFATETVNIAELLILERKTRCPFFLTKSLIPSENIVRGEEIMSLSLSSDPVLSARKKGLNDILLSQQLQQ